MQNVLRSSSTSAPPQSAEPLATKPEAREARSQLKLHPLQLQTAPLAPISQVNSPTMNSSLSVKHKQRALKLSHHLQSEALQFQWQKYVLYLPLLFLGTIGYWLTGQILLHIDPQSIADVGLPHSYLPILVALSWGNFFTLTYLFLNLRRSTLLSALITVAVYLRLIQALPWWPLLLLLIMYLAFESFLTISRRKG